MYTTSEEFNKLVQDGKSVYHVSITKVSNGEALNLPIDNFEYVGAKCVSDNITFGNAFCQKVKFSIHNPTILLGNEELFVEQGLYLEDGTLEKVPIGYFIVQKPVSDGEVTTYTCYDRMIKLEDLYMNENKYSNVFDVLYDISRITGVEIEKPDEETNYFIDTGNMGEWDNLFTMREVVGYLGGLYAKDAIVNRTGKIIFKSYEEINYMIDGHLIYQGSTSIESEYDMVVEKIVCLKQMPGYEGEEFTAGEGLHTVYMENPFMNESILEETFERISGLTFRGLSTEFLGDFRLDLGDVINVVKNNKSYKCCIMEIKHQSDGGVRTDVVSHAKTESEQSYKFTGNTARDMRRNNDALAEIRDMVNEHETEINELFQSVSNGKTIIASAITDRGVATSSTDTFQTMADNIMDIPTGGETKKKAVLHVYAKDAVIGNGTVTTE